MLLYNLGYIAFAQFCRRHDIMTFNKEYLFFISKTPPNDRFMPQTIEDPRQGPVRTYRNIFESANFSLRIQKNFSTSFLNNCFADTS